MLVFKSVLLVVLLSLGMVPQAAPADASEEHVVIILDSAFFPQKTALKHGDVVRFVNESAYRSTIFHANGGWATHPIAAGEELLVTIGPGMAGAFYGTAQQRIVGVLELQEPAQSDPEVR